MEGIEIKGIIAILLILIFLLCGCINHTEAVITGNVLINSKLNYEDFKLMLINNNSDMEPQVEKINYDGTFRIKVKEEGDYILKVNSIRGIQYQSNEINFTVKDGKIDKEVLNIILTDEKTEQTSSIKLEKAKISGKVIYPQNMKYVDIKILISHKVEGEGIKFFMPDNQGNFEIKDIDDGTYYINAQGPLGEVSNWIKVEISDGTVLNKDDIILDLTK